MTFTPEHGDSRQEKKPMKDVSRKGMKKADNIKRPAPGTSGPASKGHHLAHKAPAIS